MSGGTLFYVYYTPAKPGCQLPLTIWPGASPYHLPSRVPRVDLISVGIHDGMLQPPRVDGCGLDQIPVLGIRYRNHLETLALLNEMNEMNDF